MKYKIYKSPICCKKPMDLKAGGGDPNYVFFQCQNIKCNNICHLYTSHIDGLEEVRNTKQRSTNG